MHVAARQDFRLIEATQSAYKEWFAKPLSNAQLNSVAAYYDLVPGFERLLERNGGDLGKFYAAADKLAHAPKAERHRRLRAEGSAAVPLVRFAKARSRGWHPRPRACPDAKHRQE